MRSFLSVALFLGALLLVSCSRSGSATPQQQSVEQRVAELERQLNGGTSSLSETEARYRSWSSLGTGYFYARVSVQGGSGHLRFFLWGFPPPTF